MVEMPGGAIAVVSDHTGFDLKESLGRGLQAAGHEVLDLGTAAAAWLDCPDTGRASAEGPTNARAGRVANHSKGSMP
jgi:ribose 5-phosphate isomerase RpiB